MSSISPINFSFYFYFFNLMLIFKGEYKENSYQIQSIFKSLNFLHRCIYHTSLEYCRLQIFTMYFYNKKINTTMELGPKFKLQ